MDPPPCVQNAMMTKDKKPFTYTPGGIDLSEIRSPRMARRIERNANYEGVTDVPRQQPPPQNMQNLPPSTLAAMNPQIQVQVLPQIPVGGPQLNGQRAPPPPPPLPTGGVPPPPPPPAIPTQPLPTQRINNAPGQAAERPDMTKIIPDNPMAMLKKTGGPNSRSTFVDEMYALGSLKTPPVNAQVNRQPEFAPPPPQMQRPVLPPQPSPAPPTPPTYNYPQAEPQQKSSPMNLGSLYIPPISQQQQPVQNRVVSPPTPVERQDSVRIQSPGTPGTPTLKEAPKPWQNRQQQQQQQQEIPPWVRRDEPTSPNQNGNIAAQPVQPQFQQPPRQTGPASPINIEVRSKQIPPQQNRQQQNNFDPQQHPNAVYVTQPMVFQHPGARAGPPHPQFQQQQQYQQQQQQQYQQQQQQFQQQQRQMQNSGGTRIIPIMMEGSQSPSADRFQRQQSWNNNPTQSSSFKMLQKMTEAEENNEQNGTITEHPARYPQTFQQDGQEHFLHNETDPRYRGAAIPSKAFKMLQNMNDSGNISNVQQKSTGQRSPQPQGPQVRTIPIQIEGNEQPQKYVHPSEQVAPEPKKYMGSSIPSRSFRMLQAMTAPDACGPDQSDL